MVRIDSILNVGKVITKSLSSATKNSNASNTILHSAQTVSRGVSRTNKAFWDRIESIPIKGVKQEEQSILDMLKNSMYDLLGKTKGKAELPKEIRFEYCRREGIKKQGVANVSRDNVLHVNRDYLENIDNNIQENLKTFMDLGLISKDKNGKYKIADFLRNSKSEIFEKRLNEYNKNWPIDYKFKFHYTSMSYYANLTNQARKHPMVMLENIIKTGENANILKSCGMYKTRAEVVKMTTQEQYKYLQDIFQKYPDIGKRIVIPENTALITTPNYVFHHELGHINHNKFIPDNIYREFSSPQKLLEWQNNKKIQEVCSRVSGYSGTRPFEFVAEVYSGLVNGQTFHPDVLSLYKALKGPVV